MNGRTWTEEHPILSFLLLAGVAALIIWLLFRKGPPILPGLPAPPPLVSPWVPLP